VPRPFCNALHDAPGQGRQEQYQWEAKWKGPPLSRAIELHATFFFDTKRKADLDNFNKLSLNALTGIAYEDDSQISELHLYRRYDPLKPRIEIVARAID